jgi:hypothetical protein
MSSPDIPTPSSAHDQVELSPAPTLAHAVAGYDQQFREHLAAEIISAVTEASRVSDQNVVAIRTTETCDARRRARRISVHGEGVNAHHPPGERAFRG